jgi:crotonobetainyl-CoA:carnitine CoA-transferase CaiB-like acyl-CoA transferase
MPLATVRSARKLGLAFLNIIRGAVERGNGRDIGRAAQDLGRRVIGIEQDEAHHRTASLRLGEERPGLSTKFYQVGVRQSRFSATDHRADGAAAQQVPHG